MKAESLKKTRLAVDILPCLKERLEGVKALAEMDTTSELVRRALATYELLVRDNGRILSVVDATGSVVKYVLY